MVVIRVIINIVCASLLGACGKEDPTDYIYRKIVEANYSNKKVQINSDFISYYDSFEREIKQNPFRVSIDYGTLERPTVGLCNYYEDTSYNNIIIDLDFWRIASESVRHNLIYHELGHCALNLDHNDSTRKVIRNDTLVSIPVSIMFPTIIANYWYYDVYYVDYINELKDLKK